MKIALLIILILSYKQTIAGCCGKSKSKNNITLDCNIKESTDDLNVEEVKGGHMVKHIFSAKGGKQITKIKVGKANVTKASDKSYFSSVEVYRSNSGEMIYLIKTCEKTDSEDVIKYMYKFTMSGWNKVIVDFSEYVINKLERGEKFENNIVREYVEQMKKLEETVVESKTSITNEDGQPDVIEDTVATREPTQTTVAAE